ncbi:hypothetical protein JXJ21_26225 [candidate division KSB1 bacterium]|nr:hypothetical protein [candidate division KSB1 bacterium]
MNLLLKIARIYLPDFIKKKKLLELFELTAEALQKELPAVRNLSYRDCLAAYARFSQTRAAEVLRLQLDPDAVKKRLYKNAFQLGEKLRREFRLKSKEDVIQLSEILYQVLQIDFSATASGEVTIRRCFFSQFYSPEVCALISALDEGVAAGLSDGGELVFQERITEGKSCCRATFKLKEESE